MPSVFHPTVAPREVERNRFASGGERHDELLAGRGQQFPDDTRIFVRQCHIRLVKAAPLDQLLHPPAARVSFRAMMMNEAARSVHQQHSQITIAGFADSEQFGFAARRMLPGDKPEISGELPAVLESLRLRNRGDDRRRQQWSNAGNRGEPLADRMRVEDGFDALIDQEESFFERAKLVAQGLCLVGDITYLPLQNGRFCYLASFQDKFTRRIVGWQVSANMTAQLVIDAFNRARQRGLIKRGAIIHTDRGSQYASVEYRRLLYIHGYRQSMSAKGNCYDNGVPRRQVKEEILFYCRVAKEMRDDSSKSGYRTWLQTTTSCCGQKPW